MSNFCLIAFIPSIILVIWLLIEVRKYVRVNKKFKFAKLAWRKEQELKSRYHSDDEMVQSIPPARGSRVYAGGLRGRYGEGEEVGSKEHSDFLDYEVDDGYSTDYDYGYDYASERQIDYGRGGRRARRMPVYDEYATDDYYSTSYEQEDYDYPVKRVRKPKGKRRLSREKRVSKRGRKAPPEFRRGKRRPKRGRKKRSPPPSYSSSYDDEQIDWD
jgi:hypothetical protein